MSARDDLPVLAAIGASKHSRVDLRGEANCALNQLDQLRKELEGLATLAQAVTAWRRTVSVNINPIDNRGSQKPHRDLAVAFDAWQDGAL